MARIMHRSRSTTRIQFRYNPLLLAGLLVIAVTVMLGLRIGLSRNHDASTARINASAGLVGNVPKSGSSQSAEKVGLDGRTVRESVADTSHRQPLQYGVKSVEPAAMLAVLANGKQTVDDRVRLLQRMRGILLSKEERDSALAFLAGRQIPEGMGKGSMQWLADELLTVLRLQQPPWDGLAEELAKVAFQPGTDPVVRDYIMQHLGHLWEQYGARKEIDAALWRAVASADGTTPGTALIALSRGYERDRQEKGLAKVRRQALVLAQDATTPLAVRVTALSIAGDGGSADVKKLVEDLMGDAETPVILRKVAGRVEGR